MLRLPAPCVIVLVGPSGSGKSTWAQANMPGDSIVSSDRLRAMVGTGEHDLRASADAFEVLDTIVERRMKRRLTTVIDTLGMDGVRRAKWLRDAAKHGCPVLRSASTSPHAKRRSVFERVVARCPPRR